MRIAIVGYGRMGHEVEQQAAKMGFEVAHIVDNAAELKACNFEADELVIEFSQPDVVLDNLSYLLERGLKVVCGTTGWYEQLPQVAKMVDQGKGSLLYGANFSLGMQLFWLICQQAAQLFDKFSNYDVAISEAHHRHKVDAPSGSALKTAELVLAKLERKQRVVLAQATGGLLAGDLQVAVSRCGSEPGYHSLCFDSDEETLTISHQVRSRSTFASGAILAGQWLFQQQGLYSIDDYLQQQLDLNSKGGT